MMRKLHESAALLEEFERQMEAGINARMPRSGKGVEVRGQWPIYLFSGTTQPEDEAAARAQAFQLQMSEAGGLIRFTRGRVQAGAHLVIPTIGALDVDHDDASLPLLSGGGQVFAKYDYTLNPATVPYDWNDLFVSCELVQIGLNATPPETTRLFIGNVAGVDTATGTAYTLLMCYGADGETIHYGQSSILPPDPDDDFPTEFVVFVAPQVMHVA